MRDCGRCPDTVGRLKNRFPSTFSRGAGPFASTVEKLLWVGPCASSEVSGRNCGDRRWNGKCSIGSESSLPSINFTHRDNLTQFQYLNNFQSRTGYVIFEKSPGLAILRNAQMVSTSLSSAA